MLPAGPTELRYGRRVRLRGLVAAAELNGAVGRLRDFYPERGRWAVAVGGCAAPKLLKPENLEALPPDPLDFANVFVDVLADDVVLRMCSFLPGRALLDVGCACGILHNHAQHNVALWRSLCRALLGEALTVMHEAAWAGAAAGAGARPSAFWRALFRAGYEGRRFRYASELRGRFPLPGAEAAPEAEGARGKGTAIRDYDEFSTAMSASGHTVSALGHLMVVVGGWRPLAAEEDLFVCALDLRRACLFRPRLAPDSARPCRRLRHTSCVVRLGGPAGDPRGAADEEAPGAALVQSHAVLVLGGCNDRTHEPCSGLQLLLLLEFLGPDQSEVRWREVHAEGQAPRAIWHHTAGAFAQGKRVIVFGGDFPTTDPEFARIGDRANAAHVYILDVDARRWERVATRGDVPSWRSLHASATYTSLSDGSERLVIMGGCERHLQIFGGAEPASMEGYSLSLQSFKWQSGSSLARRRRAAGRFLPPARMRFAAERYGRHLLVYGGHGRQDIEDDSLFLTLNLMTLEWRDASIAGKPAAYEYAPAAVLCGGCLVGGVKMGARGVVPIPKLDFVSLCHPERDLD